jgi:hypothetical protein
MTEIFSNSKVMIGQTYLAELLVVSAPGVNTVLLIAQLLSKAIRENSQWLGYNRRGQSNNLNEKITLLISDLDDAAIKSDR